MTSSNSQDDDICEQLGLATIKVPQLLRSPLPLQCLAADALSDEWKQEIEQLTDSSIKEIKKGSPVPSITSYKSHSSTQRDSGTISDECEPPSISMADTKPRETIVSVPLQFFSNGVGLRIIGGVKCLHSNERHAKIMYVSGREDRENIPEQVAALHGRCVLDFNGHSLRGATFEKVRKITMATKDILVNLTLTDCSEDPSNSSAISRGPRDLPPPVKIKLNEQTLTMNKRLMFRRRFSVGDINGSMRNGSHSSLHRAPSTMRVTSPTSRPTSKVELRSNPSSETVDHTIKAKVVDNEDNKVLKEDTPTKTSPAPPPKLPANTMAQYSMDMPKGMIQLSFNYVKPRNTLYISLFKIKFHSLTIGSEPSGCFFNTYLFPDKREQGVKFSKIILSTLPTEEAYSRSASYILTENETKTTSIRIIIWEQSGQSLGNKNFTFKGEVFLALNDEEIVNLHGVVQTYSIAEPDPNLPKLPKAYHVSSSGGGKLMKKVMDSTLGVMTMRRRKKSGGNLLPLVDTVPKSGSLNDLTDGDQELPPKSTDIKKILAPLKRQTNLKEDHTPLKEDHTQAKKDNAPLQEDPAPATCSVMLRPATLESRSPYEERGLSLYDFLNSLDPDRPKTNKTKPSTTIPNPPLPSKSDGLSPKSPLFSSCEDLRPTQLSEPNKRRASAISDGTQSFSRYQNKLRGSIHSLFDSFGRPHPSSQISSTQPSSCNSMLLSDSDLSSSVSSLSMDKHKEGGQKEGWQHEEDLDIHIHEEESYSEISLTVPQLSTSSPLPPTSSTTTSPLHNSITFRPSSSPDDRSITSSTDSLRITNDTTTSTNSENSYGYQQVPVISSDPETFSSADSNHTITVNDDSSTNTSTCKGMTSTSPSLLSLSPGTRNRLLPVSSTPKKSSSDNSRHHVPQSKSMGNMSDELFFMGSEEGGDSTSLSEFMEKELSCLDTADNFLAASQDSTCSLTLSQREALECSFNSSSLDFNHSPPNTSLSQDHSTPYNQHRADQSPTGRDLNHSLPVAIPKHKWASMDDLQTSGSTPTLISKSPKNSPKLKPHHGLTEKLSQAYKNGKAMGTTKLNIVGLCVSSQIKLSIKDLVFFDQKLMNGDYSIRVNLYSSVSKQCEKSMKGIVSLKKNQMEETKMYNPSSFVFGGNPMMYHLQIILQLSNKLFSKRKYHVWIDLKKLTSESYDKTDWFNVVQLSV